MHLELLNPPALVGVAAGDGGVRPALLLATRGDRRYLQVSRGPGANHLRWVDATRVRPAPEPGDADLSDARPCDTGPPAAGLPWARPRSAR